MRIIAKAFTPSVTGFHTVFLMVDAGDHSLLVTHERSFYADGLLVPGMRKWTDLEGKPLVVGGKALIGCYASPFKPGRPAQAFQDRLRFRLGRPQPRKVANWLILHFSTLWQSDEKCS